MGQMGLRPGDLIGLAAPSHIADEETYAPIREALVRMGYRVKTASHFYSSGWGFAAAPEDRAADLHELAADDEVKMIFFGGGEGADDVIPLLNYDLIAAHPKMWMSFSDGTSILNAVQSRTGLNVYYGFSPNDVVDISEYNRRNFLAHVAGGGASRHIRSGAWHVLTKGVAEGILGGGYLDNFTYLANGGWVACRPGQSYILALEEHSMFFCPEHFSDEIARLEHSPIFRQTRGVLFGQYSDEPNEHVLNRLRILGQRWGIPVAYCDDFGHGKNHAIFPFGRQAVLNTIRCDLIYTD